MLWHSTIILGCNFKGTLTGNGVILRSLMSRAPFIQQWMYWCRLVKSIGGKPKYWGKRVVITDESIGISQLLGARAQAVPPKSMPMAVYIGSRDEHVAH